MFIKIPPLYATHKLRSPSQVATVAVAHDAQREALAAPWSPPASLDALADDDLEGTGTLFERSIALHDRDYDGKGAIPAHMRACADALSRGNAIFMVGGPGLTDPSALSACDSIRAATGCRLVVENAFARCDRGAGRPRFERAPYFPASESRREPNPVSADSRGVGPRAPASLRTDARRS